MKNNKSINIYMGIIGEAYVDKETAYAVLLAAKKNILDVQAIIEAANALNRPLDYAIIAADKAITDSVNVYNKLKTTIAQYNESDLKFAKLYALLSDLNENDFDDNFSNGGNIFTARENKTFAESLVDEIHAILKVANELLDANKLNAVVRCKEYNIAKEMFDAMIPEKIVSPEDISDVMESELIKRINAVRNNIDYINIVSDEISQISEEVSNKIDSISSGEDQVVKATNETLYWYAGNINPHNNDPFMTSLGFSWNTNLSTYLYQPEVNEFGDIVQSSLNKDFGIDGPLKANKWFHHPLHLVQDGQLIAGVDGGKAKYAYWYVAVPRYVLTFAGETAYARDESADKGSKAIWAAFHADNEEYVKQLIPCRPQDYEHTTDVHGHPIWDNVWMDNNSNKLRDDADDNIYGYEKVTTPDNPLSINSILYDVWRTPVTIYNKQRLNVYFNLGEPQHEETVNGLYWYVGKNKPSYDSDPLTEEGWMEITETPTAESPLTHDAALDSKIFYIAIPKGFGIFNADGVDLTDPEYEVESPYTLVYSTLIGKYNYTVYITGNEEATFFDKVYAKEGTTIIIDPVIPDNPDNPDTPSGVKYWYAGSTVPTAENIASIATGSSEGTPNWPASNPQSVAATNDTVESTYLYWAFPTEWNVTILDVDKVTEMQLATVGVFTYNKIEYIVLRTGRTIAVGTTKNYWAKVDGSTENPNQGGEEPENPNQGGEEPENPNQGGEEPENPNQGGEEPENPNQGGEEPENPNQGGEEPQEETSYYWYAGSTVPTAENISEIHTGSSTNKPEWTAANPQSVAATNDTEESSYLYWAFPTEWNVIVLDSDKVTEMQLASEGTFTYNNIEYTVNKTGRTVSAGTTKDFWAKC